jgi:hypothetical protein
MAILLIHAVEQIQQSELHDRMGSSTSCKITWREAKGRVYIQAIGPQSNSLNQATLTMGTQPPSQLLRDARQNTYTLQWTAPPMIWPLSLIFTNNIGWSSPGQPTPTNRLAGTTNYSTVVALYLTCRQDFVCFQ